MLRIRWLGMVRYRDAHALQHALVRHRTDDYLLLLEHPHVYTMGRRARPDHLLSRPEDLGAELVSTDRGGDITYHGPGQLVGYPIRTLATRRGGLTDVAAHVRSLEDLLIEVLGGLGLRDTGRLEGFPGVWVGPASPRPRKIAAVGVRLVRGRSMHGFALNVAPDLDYFGRIVPCGIPDKGVTSLAAEGVEVAMGEVVDLVAAKAARLWGASGWEREGVDTPAHASEVEIPISMPKPQWMRQPLKLDAGFVSMKKLARGLELVTVCEEAGCPNIAECWNDGTATFMINGDRCTRACGFCMVDTRRPMPPDPTEPERVARAVERLGLDFAVITAVARDDLPDGGAAGFARCISAIRARCPATAVEVLIPDCKGDPAALEVIFEARPDVLNHNIETVARLQRRVRPSASYARSLAVLARARQAGLLTKSGLMLGLGETEDEVIRTLADLRAVGVQIVTIGQYLRPTSSHLPVLKWWTPTEFERIAAAGRELGIPKVVSTPFTRSSHRAKLAATA